LYFDLQPPGDSDKSSITQLFFRSKESVAGNPHIWGKNNGFLVDFPSNHPKPIDPFIVPFVHDLQFDAQISFV